VARVWRLLRAHAHDAILFAFTNQHVTLEDFSRTELELEMVLTRVERDRSSIQGLGGDLIVRGHANLDQIATLSVDRREDQRGQVALRALVEFRTFGANRIRATRLGDARLEQLRRGFESARLGFTLSGGMRSHTRRHVGMRDARQAEQRTRKDETRRCLHQIGSHDSKAYAPFLRTSKTMRNHHADFTTLILEMRDAR